MAGKSGVEKVILHAIERATGERIKTLPDRQVYLRQVAVAVSKLPDDMWVELPEGAQRWTNDSARVIKKDVALPDFLAFDDEAMRKDPHGRVSPKLRKASTGPAPANGPGSRAALKASEFHALTRTVISSLAEDPTLTKAQVIAKVEESLGHSNDAVVTLAYNRTRAVITALRDAGSLTKAYASKIPF